MGFWDSLLKVANKVVSFGLGCIGVEATTDDLERIESSIYHGRFSEIPKEVVDMVLPGATTGNWRQIGSSILKKLGGVICDATGVVLPQFVIDKVVDTVIPIKQERQVAQTAEKVERKSKKDKKNQKKTTNILPPRRVVRLTALYTKAFMHLDKVMAA